VRINVKSGNPQQYRALLLRSIQAQLPTVKAELKQSMLEAMKQ
jgi:hypothetical protein